MRRTLLAVSVLFLTAAVFISWTAPAFAHEYKTDGDITVLLHTDPLDNPIDNQPTELLFGITDTSGRFSTSTCKCELSIVENGKTILDRPLEPWTGDPSLYDYQMPFTFPEPAVYSIVVTGVSEPTGTAGSTSTSASELASTAAPTSTAGSTGAFQNFEVTYDEKVAVNPNDPGANSGKGFWYGMAAFGIVIIGAIYLCYLEIRKPRNSQ